jgi:2-methylisocitrate lyase-like PEP mutase family enzyme
LAKKAIFLISHITVSDSLELTRKKMAVKTRKKGPYMTTQHERAKSLKNLHIKGDPLILFNIWDAGSAKAIQETGAKVIATSSWAVAAAHGCGDGEQLSFDLVLANLKRIIASVDLPVTVDIEGGYGQESLAVGQHITKVIEAGAVGINFEDQIVGGKGLYSIEDQCKRIEAIRKAADLASVPIFINAKTDIFSQASSIDHNDDFLREAIDRANAYAKSGADGFFAPGLRKPKHIGTLCELSSLPVNIMVLSDTPSPKQLTELGVARISYGPIPYRQTMDNLKEAGRRAFSMSE